MLVLLAGIFVVHIATVIMLFVSTIANVWVVADRRSASVGLWKNCSDGSCEGLLPYGEDAVKPLPLGENSWLELPCSLDVGQRASLQPPVLSYTHTVCVCVCVWGGVGAPAATPLAQLLRVLPYGPQTFCTQLNSGTSSNKGRSCFCTEHARPGSPPALLTQSKTSHSSLKGP
uniref:Epithelial membrane protein 1 n=1 Tax=Pipistrellus kuhlii TaxID=59472 RepID=A0A7J7ZH93_PIPKU|nr:epithelial membrane protein 1 [Pipistrellus kuhlii]